MCFTSEEIYGDGSMTQGFFKVLDLSVLFRLLGRNRLISDSVNSRGRDPVTFKASSKYNNSLVY